MALSEALSFVLRVDDSGALRSFGQLRVSASRDLGQVDNKLDRIGGQMQVAGAAAVGMAAVSARALGGFVAAFEDAEAQSRKLDQGLANNASAAAVGRDAFEDLADSLQDTTMAEGDAVVGLEGMLATLGRTGDEILELTPLIVDLARRYGLDFEAAGRLVNNAVEGNTTRLERLIGPMEEAESVASALSRTVGGFAEREAKSFSGQLEILKNNLGDVAEGIGGGVLEAVNSIIGPVKGAADAFADMDPAIQSTVGKVAAFGTAGLGAVGAISFLAGTVAKLSDRFTTLDIDTGTRSLNNFGRAATALGAAGAIAGVVTGLVALSREMNDLQVDVEAFAAATETELDRLANGSTLDFLAAFGTTAEDIASQLVESNVPAAERFAEALERNGVAADGVREIIEEKRLTDAQAAVDQDAYTESVHGAAEALEEVNPLIGDVNAQLEANAQRNDEARQAQEQRTSALLASFDAEIGYRESVRQTNEAVWEYTQAAQAGTASSDELAAVQDEAATSAIRMAEAALQASGALEGSAEGNRVLVAALQSVADKLAPGSPLRVQLEGYINQLNRIPTSIQTVVETIYRGVPGQTASDQQVSRKSGVNKGGGVVHKPGVKPHTAGKPRGPQVTVLPGEEPLIPTGPTGLPVHVYGTSSSSPANRSNTPVTRADHDVQVDRIDDLITAIEKLTDKLAGKTDHQQWHDEDVWIAGQIIAALSASVAGGGDKPFLRGTDGRKQQALSRAVA